MNHIDNIVHDAGCEIAVLGSILSNSKSLFDAQEFLSEDCFTEQRYKEIYNAIKQVLDHGDEPNILSVYAQLSKNGSSITAFDLSNIAGNIIYGDITPHAARLSELDKRRKLLALGQKLIDSGTRETEDIDDIRQRTIEGINTLFEHISGIFTLNDTFKGLLEIINNNQQKNGEITGSRTGFRKIDTKGGLQSSDLIIIAGETSQGKTSFALSIAKNAIQSGEKVAMYSMEMTKEQLSARLLASESRFAANDILYSSSITYNELQNLLESMNRIEGDNMFFDDRSTSNIDTILVSIRTMKLKHNINGAIIDYLQILNVNMRNHSREQIMGDVARRLKNLAKELGIWIIALSQLNRDSSNPVPNLNRLRDSGQIAEAADVVMFVYRPSYYNLSYPAPYDNIEQFPTEGTAMIDVAKGRNIGTFKFFVDFDPSTTSFTNRETEEPVEEFVPIDEVAPF